MVLTQALCLYDNLSMEAVFRRLPEVRHALRGCPWPEDLQQKRRGTFRRQR
jgi:hypothetical protein